MNLLLPVAGVSSLAGLAGVIAHAVSFDTQYLDKRSPLLSNHFVPCWFAVMFLIASVNLLFPLVFTAGPVKKSPRSRQCDIFYSVVMSIMSFISLVGCGVADSWMAFAWLIVTFIPLGLTLFQLVRRQDKIDDSKGADTPMPSVAIRALSILFTCIKVISVLIMIFLTAGSLVAARANSYPAPGTRYAIQFDGHDQPAELHVYCIGTAKLSLPTIFITSSPAHGVVDFYGFQHYLNAINGTDRRVCTMDNIGFGWSQQAFGGQFTSYEYVYRLFLATGEPQPWNLIGWGGGGSSIVDLAFKHPASVKSVTFLEVYPAGIEFDYYAKLNSLDTQGRDSNRHKDLTARVGFSKLILGLGIPWGLIAVFVPMSPVTPGYYPVDKWPEFRVQTWKSPMWISQWQAIRDFVTLPDSADPVNSQVPLPAGIPLLGVYCNATDSCFNGFQNETGAACEKRIKQNLFYNKAKFDMVNLLSANNATLSLDYSYNCGQGGPVETPKKVAESVLGLYALINA